MNKLSFAAAALATAIAAPAFAALTATGTFNVNITLTPKCEIFNESGATTTIGNLAMGYTSFQTTSSIGSTSFKVRCTQNQGYSLALDSASVTDGTTGLAYTLNLSGSATHAATANGAISSLSGNGNSGQQYYVHGNIAANQDGNVTAGTANNTRTLTITY